MAPTTCTSDTRSINPKTVFRARTESSFSTISVGRNIRRERSSAGSSISATFRTKTAGSSTTISVGSNIRRNISSTGQRSRAKLRTRTAGSSSTISVGNDRARERSSSTSSMGRTSRDSAGLESSSSSSKSSKKNAGGGSSSSKSAARGKKTVYKHVPHSLKPVHLVAKRNARERRRVQAVNSAFLRLRKHVPYEPRHKRLSKVKTLRVAITYISRLQGLIHDHDRRLSSRQNHHQYQEHHHNHLNILAEAASSTSAASVAVNDIHPHPHHHHNNQHEHMNLYDDGNYQFMNGSSCAEEGIRVEQPRSMALHHHHHPPPHHHGFSSSSSTSSSPSSSSPHFLHASTHCVVPGPVSVEQMSGPWPDGLHYTGGPVESSKMSSCPADSSALYFVPSCPPQQHYDVPTNGSYLPYDNFSVQSPYQLMR